jgi:hypothetical protein
VSRKKESLPLKRKFPYLPKIKESGRGKIIDGR